MPTWNLLLAGAGMGVGQVILAKHHPELEKVDGGLKLSVLPVWLVMIEEVRSNVASEAAPTSFPPPSIICYVSYTAGLPTS